MPAFLAAVEDDDQSKTISVPATAGPTSDTGLQQDIGPRRKTAPQTNKQNAIPTTIVSNPSLRDEETLVSLANHLKPTPTLNEETVQMLKENGLLVDRRNHIFLFEAADGYQIAIPAEFTLLRSESK